jgi:hypothetical protein
MGILDRRHLFKNWLALTWLKLVVEEIKDQEVRPLFSSNKMRASAPFPKRPISRAKPFSGNYLRDFFRLLQTTKKR